MVEEQRRRDRQLFIEQLVPRAILQEQTNGRREHEFVHDEQGGVCCQQKEWFPFDGPPKYVGTFKKRVKHGRQQAWYENTLQMYDWNYDLDRMHGRRRGWYEGGQLEYDNGHDYDQPHGRQQSWRKNGQPERDETCDRGKWHGSVRRWDADGKLVRDEWYEHGVLWGDREAARQVVSAHGQDVMPAVLAILVASYV